MRPSPPTEPRARTRSAGWSSRAFLAVAVVTTTALLLGAAALAQVTVPAENAAKPASTSGAAATPKSSIVILGIDGLDPDIVDLLAAEGKMPNFSRLRKEGAYGRFLSSKPMLSPILWTTIATGKRATEHGIGHFTAINEKTHEQLPVTSQMRRVKALWNLFSEADRSVAVVGWWATWPAERINGVMVSDHTCYHFLFDGGFKEDEEAIGVIHPPERAARISARVVRPEDVRPADIAPFARVSEEEFARPFAFNDDLGHFKWAWATAESYRRIGLDLLRDDHPDLLMVYVEGVDSSSHLFGHLFRAAGLSGELAEHQRRFGDTVEQMYLYADRLVGEYMQAIGPEATLIVLSDHGFSLGALPEDPSKTRDMRRVSAKNHDLEGILYLWGAQVRRGAALERPTLLDITPTVLALAGLPPALDMPGRVLKEGLEIDVGPRLVATYETPQDREQAETAAAKGSSGAQDASVDPAIMERLRALGYIDETESPAGDRTMAALKFEEGNFEEAVIAYREQLRRSPDDASLHASLGGALGALGRYDEARAELERSLGLEPLNPGAHHNLGVVHERQDRRAQAIESYRTALRYDPGYEPAQKALRRLGATAAVRQPSSDAERRARTIADQASTAARSGDYARAVSLLDEAARIAPDYVLVYQYKANVAFLMGDREAAKAALRSALAIEPDNALFRRNLESIEKGAAVPPAAAVKKPVASASTAEAGGGAAQPPAP